MPAPPGWLARRPLVPVAVALILGIALADALPHAAALWLTLAALSLAGGRFVRPLCVTILLLISTMLAGVAIAQLDNLYFARSHLARYASDDRRLANVEMAVRE